LWDKSLIDFSFSKESQKMEKQISAEELVMWLHNNPAATDEEIRAQYDRLGKSDVAQLKRVMEPTP
jgi:hypothetical protein